MKTLSEAVNPMGQKMKKAVQMLETSLVAFSRITEIPVTFFSLEGSVMWEINREKKFCIANTEYNSEGSACMINLSSAMKTAHRLGEVYIYVCNAGLVNMCYALVLEGRLRGYFNAGPVVMGKNKEQAMARFYSRVPQESMDIPMFLNIAADFKMRSVMDVTYLSTMYINALQAPFVKGGEQEVNRQKTTEQARIGMKIVEMKKSRIEMEYPLALEQSFVESIGYGDAAVSKKLFSEYMGELMVFEGGNIPVIRLRLLTLLPKLFEDENQWDYDYKSITHFETINSAETFTEIVNAANGIIELAGSKVYARTYSGSSSIVRNAVIYIRQHFSEPICLKDVAEEIHVNNAYLSTLFKKEMSTSIVDYINDLRLESAARALARSNDSVTEIALRCGFKDASYFTKCFKAKFRMVPKEYRKQNS